MESFYCPDYFRTTEPMDLKDYFCKYNQVYKDAFTFLEGFTSKNRYKVPLLEEQTSIEKLTCAEEPQDLPTEIPDNVVSKTKLTAYPINDFARQLNVVQCKEYFDSKLTYKEMMNTNKRYLKPSVKPVGPSTVVDIRPGDDFIFSILVYRPFALEHDNKFGNEKMRFAYEIEALGANSLTELVDSIKCFSNDCLFLEVSDTKVDLNSEEFDAKKKYPSQTVFIENVFYNDYRSPNSIDLSKEVTEWAKEKNIGSFVSQSMENVYLKDLKLKLGYPYVYIHQGNCEHIIAFSDAKLIVEPVYSRWMVVKCDRFPHEKVFLCTECCDSYLYLDGKKVTDFKLYPYKNND
nr:unnamed protein product [Callosobruchus chinensis]